MKSLLLLKLLFIVITTSAYSQHSVISFLNPEFFYNELKDLRVVDTDIKITENAHKFELSLTEELLTLGLEDESFLKENELEFEDWMSQPSSWIAGNINDLEIVREIDNNTYLPMLYDLHKGRDLKNFNIFRTTIIKGFR